MGFSLGDIPVVGGVLNGLSQGGSATTPVSSAQTDEDRDQARKAYAQLMSDRRNAEAQGTDAGMFGASHIGAAPQVQAQGVAAPVVDDAQAQEIRGRQTGYLDALQGAANGTAPSVAQAQYARAQQDIAHQQLGMAGQAHGTAGTAARLAAMDNIAQGQQRAGLDAAMLRATEMGTARGQLGGALSDVRGTDTGVALQRAQMGLQAGTTSAQLAQQAGTTNAANTIGVNTNNANNENAAAEHNQGAMLQAQQITNQHTEALANQGLQAQQLAQGSTAQKLTNEQANKGRQVQVYGATLSGLAAGGQAIATGGKPPTTSDKRAKEDIRTDSDEDVDAFTRALDEHAYKYRPGAGPPGERHGPMAQEFLKGGPIGRSVVRRGDDGMLGVDTDALTMAMAGVLARVARQRKRGG